MAVGSINRLHIGESLFLGGNIEECYQGIPLLPISNEAITYYGHYLDNGKIIITSTDQNNITHKVIAEDIIKDLIIGDNQVQMTLFETPVTKVYRGQEPTTEIFGLTNHHYHQMILGKIKDQDKELPYAICSIIREGKELKELRVYCYQKNWGSMEWQVISSCHYTDISVVGNRVTTQQEVNGQLVTKRQRYVIKDDNSLEENNGKQFKIRHLLEH